MTTPYPCTSSPCIDPIFGPTAASFYWSSSTTAAYPFSLWSVDFDGGYVSNVLKNNDNHVRAVRGP